MANCNPGYTYYFCRLSTVLQPKISAVTYVHFLLMNILDKHWALKFLVNQKKVITLDIFDA